MRNRPVKHWPVSHGMPRPWRGCVPRMPRCLRGRRCGWRSGRRTCSGPGRPCRSPGWTCQGLRRVVASTRSPVRPTCRACAPTRTSSTATLAHGLMPMVVPQLRTITLGGAVTGLGIESSSFRYGLPHESVLEIDVLTGARRDRHGQPDSDHADLFAAFPNSYGSLGYAVAAAHRAGPGAAATSRCATSGSTRRVARRRVARRDAARRVGRRTGRLPRRRRVRPGECYLTSGLGSPTRRLGPATTPGSRSTTGRSGPRARLSERPRLPVALGHRLVLVLRAPSARRTHWCAGCGRGGGGAATSTTG